MSLKEKMLRRTGKYVFVGEKFVTQSTVFRKALIQSEFEFKNYGNSFFLFRIKLLL